MAKEKKEKKHISENFRMITPIVSIYVGVSLTFMGFMMKDIYETQKKFNQITDYRLNVVERNLGIPPLKIAELGEEMKVCFIDKKHSFKFL